MILVLLVLFTTFQSSRGDWSCITKGPFDTSKDHSTDREELLKFAQDFHVENWNENGNWSDLDRSFCDFQRVCCVRDDVGMNRVSELHMERNNLSGSFSDTFSKNLPFLRVLNFHLNNVENFPPEVYRLTDLNEAKFGRNPICGTIPSEFSKLVRLKKFNCNFCCLTGKMPDNMFENMTMLEETFWDGNALTGTLPSSLTKLKSLSKISFNLNNIYGSLPNLCEIQNLHDCRLGSDQDFEVYEANYSWLLSNVSGNVFDMCPDCMINGVCNDPNASPASSPLLCTNRSQTMHAYTNNGYVTTLLSFFLSLTSNVTNARNECTLT
jgi:hypothetical protein